jgi:hypothetical protein
MSIESHVNSLNTKLNNLEVCIHDAYIHHLNVTPLKKEKLQILDEIEHLNHKIKHAA